MKNIFLPLLLLFSICASAQDVKIPVYAWLGGPGKASDQELQKQFTDLREKGIDGLLYSGGHDPETYKRVGKLVKEAGMEFHTWIPTMIQGDPKLKPEWYGVSGKGESAYEIQPYAPYYKFLCPNKKGVRKYLKNLYTSVAEVEEVDGIHLDYIRYPDVILARGLWEKYGLIQDREFPEYDFCYCDTCTSDFKKKSGIDITAVEDPTTVQEWKEYRYDVITDLVNELKEAVHKKGKKINAAVFPGPSISKKLVRQEWNEWDLDAYFPMNYNDFYMANTLWIGSLVKEEVKAAGNTPVYSGLFICPRPWNKANEKDPEGHGLLPEELGDAIRESMENGAAGICLFTPGRMTDAHWAAFEEAIHKEYSKE
ncbi:glycoside hydrolase family 10 protein [Pseudozobellia thermophila]|uniref:Uncharacterized lipoprotein YddW, UPF0748 family n=1 Tax=Pseudozobellia thermophila TaxID=192903 RepID=A0A1M6M140_9FLAO|nr:hypothetical protein [Pseudozobellia thermophila]SHJ77148.1 Uncharacterized lipoprotein YddW, UPF0748 family [Pseudozobellia thermophila]